MKKLLLVLSFSFYVSAYAAVGCSTYQGLYPYNNGTTSSQTGNIQYNSMGYIVFRTYNNDPNCGIRDNKIKKYKPETYCDVIGVREWGELVNYDPSDSNCLAVPLDDFVLPFVGLIIGLAYFSLRRRKFVF